MHRNRLWMSVRHHISNMFFYISGAYFKSNGVIRHSFTPDDEQYHLEDHLVAALWLSVMSLDLHMNMEFAQSSFLWPF